MVIVRCGFYGAVVVAHARVAVEMPAPAEDVFDLLHDYGRRLEWDTLLRAARLEGATTAVYTVTFTGRPAWARSVVERVAFERETRRRLAALAAALGAR